MSVINPTSYLSYDMIKEDLMAYVKGLPDASSWVDFFESSAGQTMIELMAGLGSMFNLRIDHARRESYITEATLKSSIYLIALALGYNPHRKMCPKLKVFVDIADAENEISIIKGDEVITGNGLAGTIDSNVTIYKATQVSISGANLVPAVVGVSNAYIEINDVFTIANYVNEMGITISNTDFNDGDYFIKSIEADKLILSDGDNFSQAETVPVNAIITENGHYPLDIIIGEWKTATHTVVNGYDNYKFLAGTTDFSVASDIIIDNDKNERLAYVDILVNGTPIDTVSKVEELDTATEVFVLSTHLGDIELAFGDGILGYKVSNGDTIVINYISTRGIVQDLASITWTPSITSISAIHPSSPIDIYSYGQDEESTSKIVTLAPRYYSTLGRGVTFKDIEVITSRYPYFQDTKVIEDPNSYVTLNVSYIMNPEADSNGNTIYLTDSQKAEFLEYFNLYRMAGTHIIPYDPAVTFVDFKIHAVYVDGYDSVDLKIAIKDIINSHMLKLEGKIFLNAILSDISNIDGITRAYFEYPYMDNKAGVDGYEFASYFKLRNLEVVFYSDENTLLKNYSNITTTRTGYEQ